VGGVMILAAAITLTTQNHPPAPDPAMV